MRFPRRNILSALIACAVVVVMAGFVLALPNDTPERETAPTTTADSPNRHERLDLPAGQNYAETIDELRAAHAALYVQNVQFAAFTEAVWANYQASLVPRSSSVFVGSGDCYDRAPAGFPHHVVDRESGGDPGAVNPSSGAMSCAQILPEHFNGWPNGQPGACAGMSYDDCWALLWADGAGASNWSETL